MEGHGSIFDSVDNTQNNTVQHPSRLDDLVARGTQALSQATASRRSFLGTVARIALALTGASLIRALPVDREVPIAEATAGDCNNWYMCNIAADRTCQCACGSNSCPSGTTAGRYWDGWCCNGSTWYHIAYGDCCGNSPCCGDTDCGCARPPGHTEPYWCSGLYCCTFWTIIGVGPSC